MRHSVWAFAVKLFAWALLSLGLVIVASDAKAAQDITNQFAITRSGLVLNRTTNTFDSTVTLKNASSAAVIPPLIVVVTGLPSTVALANKAGQTQDGAPYVSPALPNGRLDIGGTLSFVLKFANPQRISFSSVLQVFNGIDLPPDAPTLISAIATGGTNAFLIGRVVGASNLPITLQATSSRSCIAGVLAGGAPVGNPVSVTTDASGYFGVSVAGINSGDFVSVNVVTPTVTAMSACVVSSRDNDSWPKAFPLDGSPVSAQDLIDAPGKARWYRFNVIPGQRIEVKLTGLPADYDVAVFKDIGKAFASQFSPASASTADLLRLTAEYAPSVFSPSVFSPSVFSPSVFSPSVFSPSVFSPSVFSPSVFSPSVFSPSVFSPSVFSPSVFSPSVFSPSVFSPSVFSSQDLAQAFSTAQTRSVISVAATPGTSDESTVVNTWNNTGSFYVRVTGRGGAFDTSSPFTLTVTKGATTCVNVTDTTLTPRPPVAASGIVTVIVTDSSKLALDTPLAIGSGTLRDRLAAIAKRTEIGGIVIDVANDARVRALKAQAATNPACPFAKNLVAGEIKGIIDSYRTNPLRYVVLVGNDDAIPFFRFPDESSLGEESGYVPPVESNSPSEASLRLDYVLSQDSYGSSTSISLRTNDYTVPGLAVGRLVETPDEIGGIIDAYGATQGVVSPRSSLVTGYDFLADAAAAVQSELQLGTGVAPDALITPNGKSPQDPLSWTATQLGQKLFGGRHDVIFLAGHFSANSALAADFATSLLTTDLVASTVDFTNAVVFSAGCHSGYNLVDVDAIAGVSQPLDWAQAFARKGATLVAGTGYQYGDTDFLEYSERIYDNFARQLRAGTGAIAIGEALVKAKLDYLAITPDIRGIHEKALLEATLFGLPMLGVNMPSGRGAASGITPVITPSAFASGPALSLALKSFDLSLSPSLTPQSITLKNTTGGTDVVAMWFNGPDGVVTKPGEPALPLVAVNVTPTDAKTVLRGVGFRGGAYADVSPMLPFSGAPTTELRGVHIPFVSPTFYPAVMWTPNYFGALAGTGGTQLLVTPVQHRVASVANGSSTQRGFTGLNLRLFYSGNLSQAALSEAPSIVGVDAQPVGTGVAFTAEVVGDPAAGIQQVWVTYTSDGVNAWVPFDLSQCVAPLPTACGTTEDSRLWKGQLSTSPSNLKYVVQAVNGVGLVALEDNRGAYFGVAGAPPSPTTFVLAPLPTSATFGDPINISGTLTVGGVPVAGRIVTINVGGTTQIGVTGGDGVVTVKVPAVAVTGNFQVTAAFAGDEDLLSSSASGPLVVAKANSSLSPLAPDGATLTGTISGNNQPLQQESVAFAVNGPGGARTIFAITNYLGQAILPPPGLPAGLYTVTQASYAGNATYAGASVALAQQFTVARTPQSITFALLPGKTFGDPDFAVFATASSTLPVSFTAAGSCTIVGNIVHLTGVGNCTITADQPGDANYDPASAVAQTFAVATNGKADQVITFGPAPTNVHLGDPPITVSATSTSPTAPPSGISIIFSSLTPSVCTTGGTNGATVTLVALGNCVIAANEAGDANYNPAPQVTLAFNVQSGGATTPQFTVTGSMQNARSDHTATLLEDGRVLIAGGFGAGTTVLNSAELYCPDNATAPPSFVVCPAAERGTFTATTNLPVSAAGQTATRLHDGTVLLIGGANSILQWFTPSSQTWSSTAPMALADRSFHTATLLASGKVFVAGGVNSLGTTLGSTFILDTSVTPATIAQGPNLTFARESHTATLLSDGNVLIAGGRRAQTSDFAVIGEYERYDPAGVSPSGNGTLVDVSAMATGRFWHAAEIAGSGVVVAGGSCDSTNAVSTSLRNTEFFSFSTGAGAPVVCNGPAGVNDLLQARRAFTLTPLLDGTLLAVGGADQATLQRSSSELLPPGSSAFQLGPSMTGARSVHQSTLLLDGRVLVTGGTDASGAPLASAEIFSGAGGGGTGAVNQPPIANAGPDQTVTAGATVQLTSAGSSDPEGRPLSYFWTFAAKPTGSAAHFSNSNAANPTFIADVKGLYVVQLIVNDGGNPPLDSAPASVRITAGNRAPVAAADAYTATQDAPLAIDAAAGVLANDTDADGDPLTAALVTTVAHGLLTLNANGSFSYSPAAGYSGPDSFTYRANDGTADSNATTVSLTVNPVVPTNHPPVANAGGAQNVTLGQLVQLNGTCTDVDGDATTPTWSFTSTPTGSSATLSSASILNPTFTADIAGTYVAQLVCNDTHVNSAPSSLTISVAAATGTITLGSPVTVQPGGSAPLAITISPAAGAGGLVITLTSDDPTIAAPATPAVTIAAGQTAGTATVNGVGVGSTTIHASATGYASGSATVTSSVPSILTVTNLNDSGAGSLRDAVAQANLSPDANTIVFAPGLNGTILLTSGQIRITGAVGIVGPGADQITIDGNANDRIFTINEANPPACPATTAPSDYVVSIAGLTLANARRNSDNAGGAINSAHTLLLDSVTLRDSVARNGGGLQFNLQYAGQALTIANAQFVNNVAKPLSTITAVTSDSGGAIGIGEVCTGARATPTTVTIVNSVFSGNRVQPIDLEGYGGAIASFSYADITIAGSRIVDNHIDVPNPPVAGKTYYGGGAYIHAKSLQIIGSEISDNSVIDLTASDQTRAGGIGLINNAPDLQTPALVAPVRIINSTISGNTIPTFGGGLWVFGNVALELDNSTLANNTAAANQTGGIRITTGATNPPGANNAAAPTLKLVSSIVANNSADDIATNTSLIPALAINASNSLIETVCSTCNISINGSGNLTAVDPLLAPLAFNGGASRTHAMLAGSPAIDAGSNPLGLATDQRGTGFPRVNGAAADMGAYESSTTAGNHPPVANAGANQNATVGQIAQLGGTCTDADNDPTTPTWSFTSKPAGSTAALSSASILNPTFTPDLVGTYVLQLICNDTHVDSAPASVTITVTSATGTITLGSPVSVQPGGSASLAITINPPAGAGGLVITLSSSDPTIASPSTPTITIAAGQTTGSATIFGINAGTTTLTAQASGYASGQASVTTSGTPFVFTVTSLNDSGAGSLRDAIAQANAAPGPNIIVFQPGLSGTITLTSGQIRITNTLTIVGPGAGLLTIDGNANDRIFTINEQNAPACPALTAPADYLVVIAALKLQNAHRNTDNGGGAINTSHSLALDSMIFAGNMAKVGGGVHMNVQYPGQLLSITSSQFTNNIAKPLSTPVTGIADAGGAVAVTENCPGARTQPVAVNIASSIFSGNRVQPQSLYGLGGAIGVAAYPDVTITDSRIVDNHVDVPNPAVANQSYFGGGMFVQSKSLRIERTEVSDNSTIDVANSGQTRGGGLALDNDAADLQTPALAMAVAIVDSTISGNADPVIGGAAWVSGNVALELDNSTVTNNSAPNSPTGGIQVTTGPTNPPGANDATPPTLKLVSSIVANNAAGTDDLGTNSTKIPAFTLNASNSLIRSICATCNITVSGSANLIAVDPQFDVLAFNGGPTRTHALLAGSPAIDAGSNLLNLATDQRGAGFPRVLGAASDMGAYEFGGNHPPVANAGPDQNATVGQLVQLGGTCTDSDGDSTTPTWSLLAKPAGSSATLSNASILTPTFTADLVGSYVAQLVCNDTKVDGAPSIVTITVTNNLAGVNVFASIPNAKEAGPVNGRFIVTRDNSNIANALRVFYTVGGTASNGSDYGAITSFVDIPANLTLAAIPINVNRDNVVEGDETVILTLSPNASYTLGVNTTATVTIADDPPIVNLVATVANASEAGPVNGEFTVSRSGGNTAVFLRVFYTVGGTASNGSDYGAIASFVDIPANQASVTIPIIVNRDNVVEGNETVVLTLSSNSTYSFGASSSASVTIADDPPIVNLVATVANASEAGPVNGEFTVSRSGGNTAVFLRVFYTVGGTASNGSDYGAIASFVDIPANQASVTIPIIVNRDNVVEGNETVVLTLSSNSTYSFGASSSASVTIADDPPIVNLVATVANASEAGPVNGEFTVSRSGGNTAVFLRVFYTVGGTASNGSDYGAIASFVDIPANQASVTIPIIVNRDNVVEGNETVVLTLSSNSTYSFGASSSASVTIADDPPIVNLVATVANASEAGPVNGEFTVSRSGGNTAVFLRVFYTVGGTASNGSDYGAIASFVDIPANQASVTIPIIVNRDNVVEGNETVVLTLSSNSTYSFGVSSAATVTIADDPALVAITATIPNASETGPVNGEFTFARSGGNTTVFLRVFYTVGGTATNGNDYTAIGSFIDIPGGQASVTLPILVHPDSLVEGAETVVLTIQPNASYAINTATATVTISD